MSKADEEVMLPRWYFGGLASTSATCITHPIDLIKVQLQTKKGTNISIITAAKSVVEKSGILGLYNGISASLLRQMTYATTRFGIYEVLKQKYSPKDGTGLPVYQSIAIAAFGGFCGGFAGNPADIVNVRMQNDAVLPVEKRRNYKNVIHGLYEVARSGGVLALWTGVPLSATRAALMNVGQVAFYDEIKLFFLGTGYFKDNVFTHIASSVTVGFIATLLTHPVDVLKTRSMNATTPDDKKILKVVKDTAVDGPQAFYKGVTPAFLRIALHSVLIFIFLEQFRLHFGIKTKKL